MIFSTTFFAHALFATSVVALSNREHFANSPDDVESENWGGAVLTADTGTYTSIRADFVLSVPTARFQPDTECASVWVGIDGYNDCESAILQTGIYLCVLNTTVTYTAWYEFFPAGAINFDSDDITFSEGDSVTLSATVSTPTSGTLTVTNNSKNITVSQFVTSTTELCQNSAEWIIEQGFSDFIDFPDFHTVVFTGASASSSSGVVQTPVDATIVDLVSLNLFDQITTTIVEGDTVNITFIGPPTGLD
ncbi:peptidase G1 [Rhodocollybia butyracea]|uniref:Peptidase G1 n=1 Tax=Rhodocollybia butyracea TaxID=206335 RepID=A0A9P5PX42_9AGAR|nr:peptidase G1 [Rhodocollybia butyracea]